MNSLFCEHYSDYNHDSCRNINKLGITIDMRHTTFVQANGSLS